MIIYRRRGPSDGSVVGPSAVVVAVCALARRGTDRVSFRVCVPPLIASLMSRLSRLGVTHSRGMYMYTLSKG